MVLEEHLVANRSLSDVKVTLTSKLSLVVSPAHLHYSEDLLPALENLYAALLAVPPF